MVSETYYYDHNGQRMLAVTEDQGARFWFGERETQSISTAMKSAITFICRLGGQHWLVLKDGASVELQYADALQNLMASLDTAGTVQASFLYGPFGEVVFETGGESHRRQFNGKENDAATGLRYYGYRYYDPVTLRWNSRDPLYGLLPDLVQSEPQQLNLYAFSMNNPLRYYDPDGLAPKDDEDKDPQKPDDCESCDNEGSESEDKKPSTETIREKAIIAVEKINACTTNNCVEQAINNFEAACNTSGDCKILAGALRR
ncbi:RHS repeat-associated core domain-containing protein [Rhodohalobacter sp.]|uniref:RHS repeat domain-containing protein n=1 Tax=Rhodohalobacter sp. TaxID=1974210 RepID=UPI002ACE1BE3|nr:RHS repeat-associated core domain-containing protein [Rhodohalobacter sp.]MDZ7757522.1 RHS repeat-associated core domain-containing protein [Rhodohalobacter sp.]